MKLYAWIAVGFSGFYCGVVIGESMSGVGRIASLGMGVLGVLMSLVSFAKLNPGAGVKSNMEEYGHKIVHAKKGWDAGLVTMGLTVSALAAASIIGATDSAVRTGGAEGIRNAVYMMVWLFVWRLRLGVRLTAIATWIGCDIFVLWSMGGKVGELNGAVVLLTSIGVGWGLLTLQDWLDAGDDKPARAGAQ